MVDPAIARQKLIRKGDGPGDFLLGYEARRGALRLGQRGKGREGYKDDQQAK